MLGMRDGSASGCFVVRGDVLNSVLNVLGGLPYAQVCALVDAIRRTTEGPFTDDAIGLLRKESGDAKGETG